MTGTPAAAPTGSDLAARLRPHLETWYRNWETPPLDPFTKYNAR